MHGQWDSRVDTGAATSRNTGLVLFEQVGGDQQRQMSA